jgi:hypothetical protein
MFASIRGDWLISTPNGTHIPSPPWGIRNVRLRKNFRYGFDDPTQWPQAYVHEFRHLAAIPVKPSDPQDPLSIMWWDLHKDDFVLEGGSIVDGLGRISRHRFAPFEEARRAMVTRVYSHVSSHSVPSPKLHPLLKSLNHTCARIDTIPSTLSEAQFGLTEFQRLYLELHGLLDFLEIYLPRIDSTSSEPPAPTSCIGAFTSNPQIAQDLFDAGLPVYFTRKLSDITLNHLPNIFHFVSPIEPDQRLLFDAQPTPFPTIYSGPSNTPDKHIAIHNYTRSRMTHKDPFGGEHVVNAAAASSVSLLANLSRPVPMAKLLQHRNHQSKSSSSRHPHTRPSRPNRQGLSSRLQMDACLF